ncbi:MAG: DUF547 domain-containing protein [Pseudomonadota bacterium]
MTMTRRTLIGAAAGLMAVASVPAAAAPKSRLIDERWTRHGSGADPEHGDWAAFLDKYLVTGTPGGVNLLRYGAAAKDRDGLKRYLDAMQAVEATALSRDAAMAYWLNLYNAVTVDLVLDDYPVDSIKEVRGGLFNTGPWGDEVVRVEGQDLSLDDIEHGILRPVWRDPRIHYGVNCASIGCPNLAAEPYSAPKLEAMLEAGARDYVNHARGVSETSGGLVVSSIYIWFQEDFEDSDAGVIRHLNQYAAGATKGIVEDATRIADDRYDWALNDA